MKWIIVLLMTFLIAPAAFAQYAFQITTERDGDGKCTNPQDITADVSYTLNSDTTKQVTVDLPDSNSLDDDDNQEWFVYNEDNSGSYRVYFSFTDAGLSFSPGRKLVQYWFRYSKDGILFSEWNDCIVTRPGKPTHG